MGHFLGGQRIAVHIRLALSGRAKADDRRAADETGARILFGRAEGGINRRAVHPVHLLDVPAIRLETLVLVLGEGQIGVAIDCDAVVIVEIDELAQTQMTGQTGRLLGDAFHQVAITDNRIDVVRYHVEPGAVVVGCQPLLSDGHAHAVGKALSQRPGRRLDTGRMPVFRVAGGLAPPLAKVLQLLQREIVACQVEQGIEEHRAVAGAEDKAVAVRPGGIGRIIAQMPAPERQRGCGHAHRQAGMARIGGLHSIQRQHPNRIDHIFFQLRVEGLALEG